MNAYELADLNDWACCANSKEVSAMLRQQADRIAELEKQKKPLSNDEILEMTIWNKNLYELYVEMDKEDMIAFARAIEQRHGIR